MNRFILLLLGSWVFAGGVEDPAQFNASLSVLRDKLHEKFTEAQALSKLDGQEGEFEKLLHEVKNLKNQIVVMENQWRTSSTKDSGGGDETYALWDIGETTVAGLVMEYGATDYLYTIPPELAGMKISLYTSIPLPRESWEEMVEAILAHNGVGVKKINPFVKQLYILKLDPSAIEGIVDREEKLDLFSPHSRIFYVFSPPPEQIKSIQGFFERFSDPKQTTIHSIGSKVVLVSNKETVEKLLGLYHAVWEKNGGKVVRVITLSKIQPVEAEKVLKAVFTDTVNKSRPTFYPSGADELNFFTLPQGLVLVGEQNTVDRGEQILHDLECQLEDPGEKVIYWYACKHANPEDIAEVLGKVYESLVGSNFENRGEAPAPPVTGPPAPPLSITNQEPANPAFPQTYPPFNPVLPANPAFIQPGKIDLKEPVTFQNFIVDNKSTSVLMVVKREELPKIKTLLKKLDVPKKMVQLDVLLVEKKQNDQKQIGINLLEFGTNSSGEKNSALTFDTNHTAAFKGILSYMFSKNRTSTPAMNLTYNFLLAQEDIRINANPSILVINQTPATLSVVEEISIENGAIPVQITSTSGVTYEKSFTRAQYGTTIVLTPTIHLGDPEDPDNAEHPGFVSLLTNIEFDTPHITAFDKDKPPVTRRHIENQVCIADGETVILGGLRRKHEEDRRDKIPFLGDLPGLGKLFGTTKITDNSTEMFVFITPRIIRDPVDDLRLIRQSEYQMRAGDIPEYLSRLDEAKENERKKLFDSSIRMLLDMY
jgi:general secretion pathway protein D